MSKFFQKYKLKVMKEGKCIDTYIMKKKDDYQMCRIAYRKIRENPEIELFVTNEKGEGGKINIHTNWLNPFEWG